MEVLKAHVARGTYDCNVELDESRLARAERTCNGCHACREGPDWRKPRYLDIGISFASRKDCDSRCNVTDLSESPLGVTI